MIPSIKSIVCFFLIDRTILSYTIQVDTSQTNAEANAIQTLIEREHLNPYLLSFVIDNYHITYQAEYLHSRIDFQSRQDLIVPWKPSSLPK